MLPVSAAMPLSVCRSPPQSPLPSDIPAGQSCYHVAWGCDFTHSSAASLGTSTNSLMSCTRKGRLEEDFLGETATHFQTQEWGEWLAPHSVPPPLPSLLLMHLRKEAGGGGAGSTVWAPVSSHSLGSANGQKPSTVLCAGSSGAHSQQQFRGLPVAHCISDSYRL